VEGALTPAAARAGLCGRCRHAAVVRSARGSEFWRCGMSDRDPRYPRYPRLPVIACAAFSAGPPQDGDARQPQGHQR